MKIVKDLLRSVILSCLVWVVWSCLAWGQGTVISPELMKEITEGHARLKEYTQTVSGKIVRETISADDEQTVLSSTRLNFYCQPDSARLEYFFPREETSILSGYVQDDPTVVYLRTKEYDYEYNALSTGANHSATLFKKKKPAQMVEAIINQLQGDLATLHRLPGFEVFNLLQNKIGNVEHVACNGVENALSISGEKEISSSGAESNWKIILDPQKDYALIYYEYYAIDKKKGMDIFSCTNISLQTTERGEIFPREIIKDGTIQGEKQTTERIRLEVVSTDKQDEKLFEEESFKELGLEYTIVESDQNERSGSGHVTNAGSSKSEVADYHLSKTVLFPAGLIVVLLFILLWIRQRVLACRK
ncbi:MAG: hypothetical protein Q4G68_12500 [Planctomycetia bacterium]|nr:hypothetical protein [Planctomycetia bacterium]